MQGNKEHIHEASCVIIQRSFPFPMRLWRDALSLLLPSCCEEDFLDPPDDRSDPDDLDELFRESVTDDDDSR